MHKANSSIGQYIEHTYAFIASSDPDNGATRVTKNGSAFTVVLDQPIMIPKTAASCTVELVSATVWWVMPNVSPEIANDQFNFIVSATPYNFTIPKGLYSRSALDSLIGRELVNLGFDSDDITLSEDTATQKTIFIFKNAGWQVDFTQPDSPLVLTGFDARLIPAAPSTAGQSDSSDNTASFNTINSFLIHTPGLVTGGIPINNQGRNIIASVPIDVNPGSQIVFQPRNPVKVDANELIGKTLNAYNVELTSESNEEVDTNGEFFDFVGQIRYWLPVYT